MPTAGAVYPGSVGVTSAGSDDVQVMAEALTDPVVISGRFSVVRDAGAIASRSAEGDAASTTNSNVIVLPSEVVAVEGLTVEAGARVTVNTFWVTEAIA